MAKKPVLQIVTANHLTEGHSVFLSAEGWTADHTAALIAPSVEEAGELERAAKLDEDRNLVVGVYLVDVALNADGHPEPTHYREKLRVRARPSFWADEPVIRKAAKFACASAEAAHVSI
jgi:hypothetical protein